MEPWFRLPATSHLAGVAALSFAKWAAAFVAKGHCHEIIPDCKAF